MSFWKKISFFQENREKPYSTLPAEKVSAVYTKLRFQMLEATFIGYASYYLVRTNLPNAIRAMKENLSYTQEQMGFILSATGLAYGLGIFLLGGISDRSNPRIVMPLGLVITAFLNFLFGSVGNYYVHLFLWTLNGFVQGIGWGPCGKTLGHWFSVSERGKIFGIWNIAHNVGEALLV